MKTLLQLWIVSEFNGNKVVLFRRERDNSFHATVETETTIEDPSLWVEDLHGACDKTLGKSMGFQAMMKSKGRPLVNQNYRNSGRDEEEVFAYIAVLPSDSVEFDKLKTCSIIPFTLELFTVLSSGSTKAIDPLDKATAKKCFEFGK